MIGYAVKHDMTMVALGARLHNAVLFARQEIARMPENIDLDQEIVLIDKASADACEIAEEILAADASAAHDRLIKRMAIAWLDGTYPKEL